MGLIQAVVGSVGGMLADQWKDFYTIPDGLPSTAALFAAVPRGTNAGRGSNTKGSSNIITNGSKIVVPEGYGLLLMQDGAITNNGTRAWVRAERAGSNKVPGDGRVYLIGILATDAGGLTCTGTVRVDVPHDQRGRPAKLSPGRWNSITGQKLP